MEPPRDLRTREEGHQMEIKGQKADQLGHSTPKRKKMSKCWPWGEKLDRVQGVRIEKWNPIPRLLR